MLRNLRNRGGQVADDVLHQFVERRLLSLAARRGAADRCEHCQAAGAIAQAVIRSVELIVQPDAHDVVGQVGPDG